MHNQGNQNSGGRGLASADEETKERVAKASGEAVSEDREHMSEIGKKGGQSSGGGNKGNNRNE